MGFCGRSELCVQSVPTPPPVSGATLLAPAVSAELNVRCNKTLAIFPPLEASGCRTHQALYEPTTHYVNTFCIELPGSDRRAGVPNEGPQPDNLPTSIQSVRLLLPSVPDGDSCAKLIRDLQRKENIRRFHFDHRQNRSPAQWHSDVWIDVGLFFN